MVLAAAIQTQAGYIWTVTQLTDNSYDDKAPQVSGSNVVWSGYDGNDYEIFLATASESSVVPEPSSIVLCGMGIVTMCGYGWRRRKRKA